MWWKPASSLADVLWSSGLRVMEPSSQTIRVSWRIAALPPSIAPWAPLGSPPSRSTPSHRDSRAAFGGMFSPAPAVLGVRVCSKTSIVVKTPDSRSARAVISPAMPPPAISARIKTLQLLRVGNRASCSPECPLAYVLKHFLREEPSGRTAARATCRTLDPRVTMWDGIPHMRRPEVVDSSDGLAPARDDDLHLLRWLP